VERINLGLQTPIKVQAFRDNVSAESQFSQEQTVARERLGLKKKKKKTKEMLTFVDISYICAS
jgi:hypothetical protein